jgi:hypothetical protein
MKKQIAAFFFGITLLLCCTSEKKSAIEGTWELTYFKWSFPDSVFFEYPGNIKMCDSRFMVSDDNSLWYFKYKTNTDSAYTIEFGDM